MQNKYAKLILLLIPVVSVLLHWKFFSLDLVGIHVWRQTQTQTVINNFAHDDFNIFHPKYNSNPDTDRIVRMEFPIMQWLFAIFFKIFGPHIIISRILTFLMGLFSVFGMYVLLRNIFGNAIIGALGAWAFNFSPLFFYYTINPLPDNFAMCCGIWSVAFFWKWIGNRSIIYLIISFLFLGLAALVKLPFILYASVPIAYLAVNYRANRNRNAKSEFLTLILLITSLLPSIIWYVWVIPTWNGNGVLLGMTNNKLGIISIVEILLYDGFSMLPELLINYAAVPFFLCSFYFIIRNKAFKQKRFSIFLIWALGILFYFLFELNMIRDTHDYYLFPFLPVIFILVAYGAYHLYLMKRAYFKYAVILLLTAMPLTAYLRVLGRFDTIEPGFNGCYYKYKNELRQLPANDDYCVVGNDPSGFILLYYIDKKGWSFDNNYLPSAQLKTWIDKGAKYLYTDSFVDTLPDIKAQLAEKIFEKGTLRVYRLRGN